ncbi:MAG: ABC transporter ATP-binding protein [Microthrixaceae bacterium]
MTHKDDWLSMRSVDVRFGGVHALSGVTFDHRQGEVLGLIGPNGAGKTTLLNTMTGLVQPHTGSLKFQGEELAGKSPQQIVSLGIVRTFQNTELYAGMDVRQNVMLGCHPRVDYGIFAAMGYIGKARRRERQFRIEVDGILDQLGLLEYADLDIEGLPYGVRKRIEIARALALRPKVLLLDEPAAGATDEDREALLRDIRHIVSEVGASVILIEHDVKMVMTVCDRIAVLNWGEVLAIGTPDEIRSNREVEAAYLGV